MSETPRIVFVVHSATGDIAAMADPLGAPAWEERRRAKTAGGVASGLVG